MKEKYKRIIKSIGCSVIALSMTGQYCIPAFAQDEELEEVTLDDIQSRIDGIEIENRDDTDSNVYIDVYFNDDEGISDPKLNIRCEDTIYTVENYEIDDTDGIVYTFNQSFDTGSYTIESLELTYNEEEYKIDIQSLKDASEDETLYINEFNVVEEVVEEEIEEPEEEVEEEPEEIVEENTVSQEEKYTSTGSCGTNVTWTLDNGLLTVSGTGAMTDYLKAVKTPWYTYRSSITSIAVKKGVTSIGNSAFSCLSNVTSIAIPSSVTSIGSNAFSFCTNLEDINIPKSVKSIQSETFYACYALTDITLPSNVTSIGDKAFASCQKLETINIPDGITSIGEYAFSTCTSLTDITIPDGVKSIKTGAFTTCQKLTDITLPDSVTSIAKNAFSYCSGLESIHIPDSVTTIEEQAFKGCTKLADDKGFVIEGNSQCGYKVFDYVGTDTNITVPDQATIIGENAFFNTKITSIVIPKTVTSIKDFSFYGCTSLTNIAIPDSIKTIEKYTFDGCTSLKTIAIPVSVKSVGEYAFYNCSALTDVYYSGTKSQWNSISIGSYNSCLTGATIHYNSLFEIQSAYVLETDSYKCLGFTYNLDSSNDLDGAVWTSSDETIATVSFESSEYNPLRVYPKKAGAVTITGTTESGMSASATIYVEPELTSTSSTISSTSDVTMLKVSLKNSDPDYLQSFIEQCTIKKDKTSDSCTSMTGSDYVISEDGKSASIIYNLKPVSTGTKKWTITSPGGQSCEKTVSAYYNVVVNKTITVPYYTDDMGTVDVSVNWDTNNFNTSSSQYNPDLAMASFMIAKYAYFTDETEKVLSEFGFTKYKKYGKEEDSVKSGFDDPLRHYGYQKINLDGLDYNLFVVSVRGTNNLTDFNTDILDGFYSFQITAQNSFDYFKTYVQYATGKTYDQLKNGNNIVMLTGHSLGGATANRLSVLMDDFTSADKIYTYTFESPHTCWAAEDMYVTNNCFSIINTSDAVPEFPVYPTATTFGTKLFFKQTELSDDLCIDIVGKKAADITEGGGAAHSMDLDLIALEQNYEFYLDYPRFFNDPPRYVYTIGCPVDVSLYADGKLISSIKNGVVTNNNLDSAQAIIDGDDKIIAIYDESKEYSVLINGYDEGTMDVAISKLEGSEYTVLNSYDDVAIENGTVMCSPLTIDEAEPENDSANLYAVDGEDVSQINEEGLEMSTSDLSDCHDEVHAGMMTTTIVDAGSCTKAGQKTTKCTLCGKTSTEVIPAGHTLKKFAQKEATGFESGYETYWKCTRCNKLYSDSKGNNEIDAVVTIAKLSNKPVLSSIEEIYGGVDLSWDEIKGADGYKVYRKVEGASTWTCIDKTAACSYVDTSTVSGTTYYYTIRAYKGSTNSSYDKTGKKIRYVQAPKLKTPANSATGVAVKWNAITNATKYAVYRKTGDTDYEKLTTKCISTSFIDTTAVSGKTYTYTVKAYVGGWSSYNETGKTLEYLAQPSLSSVKNGEEGVDLSWKEVAGISMYRIYRKVDGGSWKKLDECLETSYTDTGAVSGTKYYYTVRAVDDSTLSSYNTTGKYITYLSRPYITSCKALTSSKGTKYSSIQFNAVQGATSYYIYSIDNTGKQTKIGTVSDTTKSSYTYKDTTASVDGTYRYQVKAKVGSATYSAYSQIVTLKRTSASCGDNATWSLDNGTLTISGTGAISDYEDEMDVPWNSDIDSIQSVVINTGITSIGENAFYGCENLKSITIPDSVTSIGQSAFEYCESLSGIKLPKALTKIENNTFAYCESLTDIALPSSVTSIGSVAFGYCTSLESVTVPNSLTSIGASAFVGCESLSDITIPSGLTELKDRAFYGCDSLADEDGFVVLGNSKCGYLLFDYVGTDKNVTIPENVTSISMQAFRKSSIVSVTIGDSVTSIKSNAFSNCTSLESITISDSVTDIYDFDSTFDGCTSLTDIYCVKGSYADAYFTGYTKHYI